MEDTIVCPSSELLEIVGPSKIGPILSDPRQRVRWRFIRSKSLPAIQSRFACTMRLTTWGKRSQCSCRAASVRSLSTTSFSNSRSIARTSWRRWPFRFGSMGASKSLVCTATTSTGSAQRLIGSLACRILIPEVSLLCRSTTSLSSWLLAPRAWRRPARPRSRTHSRSFSELAPSGAGSFYFYFRKSLLLFYAGID